MPDPSPPEQPLYEIKANLFKALAHPARIRVLEILSTNGEPTAVSELLTATELEPTLLSQHLAYSSVTMSSPATAPATPCSTNSRTRRSPTSWSSPGPS